MPDARTACRITANRLLPLSNWFRSDWRKQYRPAAFADLQLICITLDTDLLQIKAFTNIGLFVYPETHFCQRMIHRQRNSTIRLGNPCLFCGIEIICLLASGKVEPLGLIRIASFSDGYRNGQVAVQPDCSSQQRGQY